MALEIGEKVRYCPEYGSEEKGIVKSISEMDSDIVFVVYKCNNDWDNYQNYTGAATEITTLKLGWNEQ